MPTDTDAVKEPLSPRELFCREEEQVHPVAMLGYQLPPVATVSRSTRPDADTIMLVHGLGGCRRDWASAFRSPALADYHLVALDLPGHGDTPTMDVDTGTDLLTAMGALVHHTATTMLQPHSNQRVHVVAHGAGLPVVHASGLTDTEHAGRVISVEGYLLPQDCQPMAMAVASQSQSGYLHSGHQALVRKLNDGTDAGRLWSFSAMRAHPMMLHWLAGAVVTACDEDELREWWMALPNRSWLYGERNGLPEHHHPMTEGAQIVSLPHAGHHPMADNPGDLWGAVRQHLHLALAPARPEKRQRRGRRR